MTPREAFALARGYPSRVWAVCFAAYAISQLDLALWSYALPQIRVEFALTRTQLGVLTGGAFAVGGVLLVWLGLLADRRGRRTMVIAATVATSLSVAAHAITAGLASLAIARTAAIASGGLLYPAGGALVAEEAPPRIRGLMTGLLQVAYPLGWFLASLLAVLTLERVGWRALFAAGLLGLPFAWVVRRTLRESPRPPAAARASVLALFAPGLRRRTWTVFVAQYCFVIAYGGTFLFAPVYFHEARGFSIAGTATLVGLSHLIGVAGYALAAWVGEFHLTRRTTTVVWTLLGAAFYTAFLWLSDGYLQSLAAFSVMAMFLLGTAAVKFAYVAELFPSSLRATGLAFCGSFAVTLGQATGPALIGALADRQGWAVAMTVGGVLPLVAAGLLYLVLTPVPSGLELDDVQRRLGT